MQHLSHCDRNVFPAEGNGGFDYLQIPGNQQKAVKGGRIAFDLWIDYACVNIGGKGASIYQRSELLIDFIFGLVDELSDNIVAVFGKMQRRRQETVLYLPS